MLDRGGYATLRAVADHFLYWLSHDVAELETLRDRLCVLEQTGSVPRHPAEIYDDDVLKALERTFPGGSITISHSRSDSVPDFILQRNERRVLVETKWPADPDRPWRVSTIHALVDSLHPDDRLLVITNARDPAPVKRRLQEQLKGRADVVRWAYGARDDAKLHEALEALLV